jgi:hypothetical protein
MSQVRAIEILLRKSVPDLTKTDVQAEVTHRYVAQLPRGAVARGMAGEVRGRADYAAMSEEPIERHHSSQYGRWL